MKVLGQEEGRRVVKREGRTKSTSSSRYSMYLKFALQVTIIPRAASSRCHTVVARLQHQVPYYDAAYPGENSPPSHRFSFRSSPYPRYGPWHPPPSHWLVSTIASKHDACVSTRVTRFRNFAIASILLQTPFLQAQGTCLRRDTCNVTSQWNSVKVDLDSTPVCLSILVPPNLLLTIRGTCQVAPGDTINGNTATEVVASTELPKVPS